MNLEELQGVHSCLVACFTLRLCACVVPLLLLLFNKVLRIRMSPLISSDTALFVGVSTLNAYFQGEETRVKVRVKTSRPLGVLKELRELQLQDTAHYNKSCQDQYDVQRALNVDVCVCSKATKL